MIRNMGALDRVVRILVVVPAAIAIALVLGAGTLAGVILFVVAAIMLVTATTGSVPLTSCSGSRRTRVACVGSAITCAAGTPRRGGARVEMARAVRVIEPTGEVAWGDHYAR